MLKERLKWTLVNSYRGIQTYNKICKNNTYYFIPPKKKNQLEVKSELLPTKKKQKPLSSARLSGNSQCTIVHRRLM